MYYKGYRKLQLLQNPLLKMFNIFTQHTHTHTKSGRNKEGEREEKLNSETVYIGTFNSI